MKRVAKGLELGANDYILRPIDRNELLARVRSQIRQKRYQDRLVANYTASLSMALTDALTGLFNRRYVMGHLDRLVARSGEQKRISLSSCSISIISNRSTTPTAMRAAIWC